MTRPIPSITRFGVSLVLSLTLCLLNPSQSSAQLFASLQTKIQREIDSNPFLRDEGIKLRVVSEENGYVKLEMFDGNAEVRQAIAQGTDVTSTQVDTGIFFGGASADARRTVTAWRRAIDQIKQIDGVKQIILDAVHKIPFEIRGHLPIDKSLRLATRPARPLATDPILSKLERKLGRRLRPLPVGRPRGD